jgi:hypothetical protein
VDDPWLMPRTASSCSKPRYVRTKQNRKKKWLQWSSKKEHPTPRLTVMKKGKRDPSDPTHSAIVPVQNKQSTKHFRDMAAAHSGSEGICGCWIFCAMECGALIFLLCATYTPCIPFFLLILTDHLFTLRLHSPDTQYPQLFKIPIPPLSAHLGKAHG